MSTDSPSPNSNLTPQEERWLNFLEIDSRGGLEKEGPPVASSTAALSHDTHDDLVDIFSLLQLEMTYGLRINKEKLEGLQADLERYRKDVEVGRNLPARLIQIHLIELLLTGKTLNLTDMSPVLIAAKMDTHIEASDELITFEARNMLLLLNTRGYLEPAVPEM